MSKFNKLNNWFAKKANDIRSKATEPISEAAPNPLAQPFNYQAWKIIGNAFEYNEGKHLAKESNLFKEFVYRFANNFAGVFGFILIVMIILAAIIIPFTTQDPNFSYVQDKFKTIGEVDSRGIFHILGTDSVGRDFWARLWWGLRYSLALSIAVTAIEVCIGLTIGIMMGQFELFDKIMTFLIKIISVVPSIIILILLTIILNPGFWVIVFSLSLTGWIGMANQIRAQVKRAKHLEWVAASKVLGTPMYKILKNYVPVILPILITQLVFTIPGVILSETSLAFIGLAIDDVPTLGNLISEGQKIFPTYLRYVFIPSSFLIAITASVQLIGASVQDALRRQR